MMRKQLYNKNGTAYLLVLKVLRRETSPMLWHNAYKGTFGGDL